MTVVAEGLDWRNVYWVLGDVPKHLLGRAVTDPPTNGWGLAFVLNGEKHSTIFCPYSMSAYSVPNSCMELKSSAEPREWRPDFVVGLIHRNWETHQKLGIPADFDTAALVLKRLGAEVPHRKATLEGFESKLRGGKETAAKLAKPVKRKGKRGDFLAYVLADPTHSRPVRELMAHFGMTRSNALSYLFILTKDHGIGYTLTGDLAQVKLPEGVTDPFEAESAK